MTRPYLWIIDCRRGGGRHGNGHWEDEQFTRVFAQLALWMTTVERWNVVFLLPPAVFATEELITKLKLPEGCSHRRGCWVFGQTLVDHPLNFTDRGRLQQAVEPIGDIIICLQHPVGTSPEPNFVTGRRRLPLLFDDNRGEAQEPSAVDVLERSPSELSRLVGSYLPRGWGLVACSMSTAISTILHSNFQGSDIIVIDNCNERVSFLYNELSNNFEGHLLMSDNIGGTDNAPRSVNATDDAIPLRREGDDDVDFYTQFNERLPREYGTDESTPDSCSSDSQRSNEAEEREDKAEDDEGDEEEDEEEEGGAPMRDVVPSTSPPHVGVCVEETPVEMADDTNVVDVLSDAPVDGINIFISQLSESEGYATNSFRFSSELSRDGQPLGPTQSQPRSATQGSTEGIGRSIGPILPSVPRHSESEDVAEFRKTFTAPMTFRDGFYYDADGIRHTRHGDPGNYIYEQSTSISLGDSPVQEDELAEMVNSAMEHATGVASP